MSKYFSRAFRELRQRAALQGHCDAFIYKGDKIKCVFSVPMMIGG